jgi:hypothetical protein
VSPLRVTAPNVTDGVLPDMLLFIEDKNSVL